MTGGLRLRATALVVALALLSGIFPGGLGALCATAAEPEFVVPVDGPIVRRFEPPPAPYAPGHRGIDFGVLVGTEVVASGDGVVLFAGPVAGDGLFVTIAHDDLIQTTYSFMSQISVVVGQEVRRAQPIGTSGEGHPGDGVPALHFGLKVGGKYMDPEILLLGELDDISDLLSLAPIANEYDLVFLEASALGSSAGPGGGKLPAPGKPWHIKLGGMIAGFGRSVKDVTFGAASWTKDRAVEAGRFVGGVIHDVGEGISWAFNGAKEVATTTARTIGDVWDGMKDFFVPTGRGVKLVASNVGDFLGDVAHSTGKFLGSLWSDAGKFLGSVSRDAGDFLRLANRTIGEAMREAGSSLGRGIGWLGDRVTDVGDAIASGIKWLGRGIAAAARRVAAAVWGLITENLLVGMVSGTIEQIRCSQEGGVPPPDLPTSDELARGASPPRPPNDNIVVAIGGIGSHTAGKDGTVEPGASMYQLDFQTLGIPEDRVFFYSYRGIEDRGGEGPFGFHAPYTKEDTYRSITHSARLLRAQIRVIHELYPDKKIDLIAHSQGGLVAQFFVSFLLDQDNDDGLFVDHFVSIAAPHQGADAARLHSLLSDTTAGRNTLEGLDWVADELGLPPPSAPSAREMAEDSSFIRELNERWDPSKVDTTTIGSSFDVVVTAQHTRLDGVANYTADMPGGAWRRPFKHHGDVVSARSTKEIVYNALSDTPSECTALRNALADHSTGRTISVVEDALGWALNAMTEVSP